MTVKECIEILEKLPQDYKVILASDNEGNKFSPLTSIEDNSIYVPETKRSGEVYNTRWSVKDVGLSEKEWNNIKNNNEKVIVLYPEL